MTSPSKSYRFGDWLVEPDVNQVQRDGDTAHLEPLAMNVLCHLLDNLGEVVATDDLLDRYWTGRNAEPSMVTRCIKQIRSALGDDAHNPSYVETIPKRGYRAIAGVNLEFGASDELRSANAVDVELANGESAASATWYVALANSLQQRRAISMAAALLLGAGIALVGRHYVVLDPSPPPTEVPSTSAPTIRLPVPLEGWTRDSVATVSSIAISPTGQTLAFVGTHKYGARSLAVHHLDRNNTVWIEGVGDARAPFFSPDGQWVGYFGSGVLKRVPVEGGDSSIITPFESESPDPWGASWGSDDRIVFAEARSGLSSISVSEGDRETLTELDLTRRESSHRTPNYLPDHDLLLFSVMHQQRLRNGSVEHEVWGLRLSTGKRRYLFHGISPRYVATGHILFSKPESPRSRKGSLWAVPFEPGDMATTGQALPIDSAVGGPYGSAFAVADSGPLVFVPSTGRPVGELILFDVDGTPRSLSKGPMFLRPLFSNDAGDIAVTIVEEGKKDAVWVYDAGSGASRIITDHGTAAIWGPDDQSITYLRSGVGLVRQHLGRVDSTETLLNDAWHPHAWIADGDTLLFQQLDSTGKPSLYSLGPQGQVHALIEGRSAGYPSITKDQRWIAYCVWGGGGIHVGRAYDAPAVTTATKSGCFPKWSPSEDRLYFQDNRKLWSIEVVKVADGLIFGDPEPVADIGRTPLTRLYDIDESGRMVLVKHTDADLKPPILLTNWVSLIE